MRPFRPVFFWCVAAAAAGMLGFYIYGTLIIFRYGGLVAEPGWTAVRRDDQWRVARVERPGPAAGKLEPEDVVLAVNGDLRAGRLGPFFDILGNRKNFLRFHRANPAGGSYTVRVARREPLELELPVRYEARLLASSVSLVVTSLAFYIVGILVGLLRPRDRMPQLLVVACLPSALVVLAIALTPYSEFLRGWELYPFEALAYVYPFHLLLGYRLFHRLSASGQSRSFWTVLEGVLWIVGLIAFIPRVLLLPAGLSGSPALVDWASGHASLYWRLSGVAGASQRLFDSMVYFAMWGVLAFNYRRISDAGQRRRLKWIAYGTAGGLVPLALTLTVRGLLRAAGVSESSLFQVFIPAATTLTILIPITFGYAIARHRLLGVQVVVRRGIQYLLARNMLRIALFLPAIGLAYTLLSSPDKTVAEVLFGRSAYFYVAILASAALSLKYRSQLTDWLDRKFFCEAYDREKILLGLIENIKSCNLLPEISRLVCDQVGRALHPSAIYLFYRDPARQDLHLGYSSGGSAPQITLPGGFQTLSRMEERSKPVELPSQGRSELPETEEEWFRALGVSLIVPLKGTEQHLSGLLLLGEKKSDEAYGPNDRQLLQAIADQTAMVCENVWLKERVERDRQIRHQVLAHLGDRGFNLLKECRVCSRCFDRTEQSCPDDGIELELTLPVERTLEGRYRLERRLGRGGMGSVYQAQDLRLRRTVAVKILLGGLFGDQDALRRFEREAHTLARLSHPNIVAVHDYGKAGANGAYLVMELLPGTSWRMELKRRRVLDPPTTAAWLDQVLCGLQAAHEAGIVHRDLKPENLMIGPASENRPVVKILDFGLAKEQILESAGEAGAASLTAPGALLGTYFYMAPEQVSGGRMDLRADLFACGVIAVESLTGARPFRGQTLADLFRSVLHDSFHLPGDAPEIQRLDAALQASLAKDPNDRYPSAEKMRGHLIPALEACPALGVLWEGGDDEPTARTL